MIERLGYVACRTAPLPYRFATMAEVHTNTCISIATFSLSLCVFVARRRRAKCSWIESLYEACKPEILGKPAVRQVAVFQYLRGVIDSIVEQRDVAALEAMSAEVERSPAPP